MHGTEYEITCGVCLSVCVCVCVCVFTATLRSDKIEKSAAAALSHLCR